jgi:hypothetical protein
LKIFINKKRKLRLSMFFFFTSSSTIFLGYIPFMVSTVFKLQLQTLVKNDSDTFNCKNNKKTLTSSVSTT